ncbi:MULTISPECIES: DUF6230 family protein [Streptomyces]|jgi:hypothetical protein|uniref:DUF6230 family protein n=3 Tax=Streptomyces TaxID=1883 RepID=A0ABW9IEG0_STRGJ|nr:MULTISPECIES: DUF6230 family protein [Streptomyces]MCX5526598.1 DUF6230 family protein [Streptomyces bobili]MDX3527373.1 DUF6230 family protein [Streptomyces sp. ID05-39B]MDX3571506.1 DUF6230 family protein [Streptomyces sp. ID05-47C]QEU68165.1 cholesterol esterase [Streptomyces galilaeus]GGW47534.1 cholesterol esterase [Streptomyces galilaeus]
MESQVRGGTRWKRFAVVMVPSVAATACIGVALAQGALAASFSVSGQSFKVTADKLVGTGFMQYGAIDSGYTLDGKKTAHPVAVSAFDKAEITNMCQSVVTPNIPLIGSVSLTLKAGGNGKPVEADNLYIDVEDLQADATFENIRIGVAGKDLKGPGIKSGDTANPFGFGQDAERATLTGVKQTAWATTAGTFKLSGLKMSLSTGVKECY